MADNNNVFPLRPSGSDRDQGHRSSGSGEGGEPPDDMERRLASLEDGHKLIVSKLDALAKSIDAERAKRETDAKTIEGELKTISAKLDARASAETLERVAGELRASLVEVKGELAQKASATDMSSVKTAVEKLPTGWTLYLSLAGLVVTILVMTGIAKKLGI